jgi:hypothetical protein
MTRSTAAVMGFLALGACVHPRVLEPAPGATLAPGTLNVAEETVAGVTVRVTGDSWNGAPWDLYRRYTPVRVTIENRGHAALAVSLSDFGLTAHGMRYTALPPSAARGAFGARDPFASPAVRPARWDWDGFYPGQLDEPRYYYEDYQGDFIERLPTRDMLTLALPTGPVPAGGVADGFVYFQRVDDHLPSVSFEMTLTDASSGRAIGHVSLPFQTTRR